MNSFAPLVSVVQYVLMFIVLGAAIVTVSIGNLFRAAIFLAFTLLGVAGLYFFLHADFIAAMQILIYVGAIMTLVIFAVMLTGKMQDPLVAQSNRQKIPAFIILCGVSAFLIPTILKAPWRTLATPHATTAANLGRALMGEFVFPFEIVSLVLLVALIGAIATARSDE